MVFYVVMTYDPVTMVQEYYTFLGEGEQDAVNDFIIYSTDSGLYVDHRVCHGDWLTVDRNALFYPPSTH